MDKESGSAQLLFTLKAVHAGSSSTDAKTHMQWQPDGNYVAIAGTGRQIQIFDRYGHVVDDVALTAGGVVVEIAWDKDGEVLAILQSGNSAIIMWDAAQRKTLSPVETNMKDLCWMRWSKVGPELAVGSGKGNLIIYNRRTTRMNPLLGKHSKKITCGAWNSANQLALGSEDKTVTLSTEKGDLVLQDPIKGEPTDMSLPEADFQGGAKRLSVCLGRKSLFIKSIGGDVQGPIELTFAPKHGEIHVHRWYDENQILVGFQTGFVMGTSAHKDHAGKELFGAQMFKFPVTGIHLCKPKQRAAVCGENFVKFIDIAGAWTECHDEKIVAPGLVRGVQWTSDGNFLSVVLADGQVLTYLMSMPMVNANAGPFIAYMKSLREVQVRDVTDTANKKGTQSVIKVDVEPDLMAMGGEYVAMAKNNMCWFYTRGEAGRAGQRVNEVDYNSTVDRVCMNATTAAVLHGGKVNLHHITGDPDGKHTRSFPDGSDDSEISTVHLTDAFLIYGTTTGLIEYVSLDDETRPNDFRHICGIKSIWSNPLGTRLVVQDMNLVGYIYSPVSSQLVEIEEFPRQVKTVLWDKKDVGVLAVVGDKGISTYKYTAHSLRSQAWCRLVCKTEAPALAAPIVLINGELHYQTASGVLSKIVLESHSALRSGAAQVESKFEQALALGRFEDAYALAAQLADKSSFAKLRDAALEALDVATAVRVSREIEDCQTVLALEPLMSCEDRNLLGGQVALYLRDYDLAQDMLLSSSRPVAALEMRCSLRQWDKAMRLAETLAPAQTPHICLQYAEQLQSQGEYEGSLQRYQQALQENFTVGGRSMQVQLPPEHVSQCKAGIAKMHMKQGNTTRGMQLAIECGDVVCRDCAWILENLKQVSDAAMLHEKGGNLERAALLYIKTQDLRSAEKIMAQITTPKTHIKYAKAKEKQGQFKEAADAYEKGKDTESLVRLCLEHLQLPQRAFSIVRETRETSSAMDIVKYCFKNSDFRSAIEFLLIAKENEKAIETAREHEMMDALALFLGKDGTRGEYMEIARHYKNKKQLEQAAEYYEKAGQFKEALELFLQVGEKAMDKAIDVVGAARNDVLTHTLVDYLMGEHDREPKDPNYIFRLYMALGNFRQAARTAVIIAKQEQEEGNYKSAHKMLLETFKDLESQNIPVSRFACVSKSLHEDLEESLMLLHSYVLVKILVKQGDHDTGARLLVRVANNISKFPAHVVPILTSTVIECQRAGLKKTSFEYASMLMRPEYRKDIAEAYKKKIESIVRKPAKTEEDEGVSACPYCGIKSPNSQLDCPQCKSRVPYCIATGLKMLVTDWCQCPSCKFPALYSKFKALIETEKVCPMCEQEIVLSSITKVNNPEDFLKAAQRRDDASDHSK